MKEVELAKEMLLWRQKELHIARYLANSPPLKNEPTDDFRQVYIKRCEEAVKRALDDLWSAMVWEGVADPSKTCHKC